MPLPGVGSLEHTNYPASKPIYDMHCLKMDIFYDGVDVRVGVLTHWALGVQLCWSNARALSCSTSSGTKNESACSVALVMQD